MIGAHTFGGASHDPVGKALDARGGAMSQAFCRSSARAPRGPKFFLRRRNSIGDWGVNEDFKVCVERWEHIIAHSAFVLSL